jgi:hypothetical protein
MWMDDLNLVRKSAVITRNIFTQKQAKTSGKLARLF